MRHTATAPLILGGGFIGNWLKRVTPDATQITRQEADLRDADSVLEVVDAGVPWVLAASVTRLVDNSASGRTANVEIAEATAAAAKVARPSHLIFLSTCDVYGYVEEGTVLHEGTATCPVDPYGESKLESERILTAACEELAIPLTILRLPGIYGPSQQDKSVISTLFRSAVRTREVLVYGDGSQERDFVYVEDVCTVIQTAIKRKITGCFNVATGKSHTVQAIAEVVAAAVSGDVKVSHQPTPDGQPMRSPSLRFATGKLTEAFGDVPGLVNGITRYSAAVAEHPSALLA